MWAIISTIKVAWEKGFKQIIIESDYGEVVEMIKETPSLHYLTEMIWKIRQWMNAKWQVQI